MKFLSLIALLILLTAQITMSQKPKDSYVRQRKVNAFQQIFDLKQGYLLVMLHINQNKIDALTLLERKQEAEIFRGLQIEKNKTIIKTFRDKFDYCPVFFFLSSQALRLVEYGSDSVIFVSDLLEPDSSIQIKTRKYFVAEFGLVQDDTTQYSSRSGSTETPEVNGISQPYHTVSTSTLHALIIESDKMIQLKNPFPYYVSITETDSKILQIESVVTEMNRKLKKFEKKAKKKILTPRFSPYFKG